MVEKSEGKAAADSRSYIGDEKSWILQVSTRSVQNHPASGAVRQHDEHDHLIEIVSKCDLGGHSDL